MWKILTPICRDGYYLIWRLKKVSIGDQLDTTYGGKEDHFEENWSPITKFSIVSMAVQTSDLENGTIILIFSFFVINFQSLTRI